MSSMHQVVCDDLTSNRSGRLIVMTVRCSYAGCAMHWDSTTYVTLPTKTGNKSAYSQ
jgi:hypothetical protein